MKSIAVKVLAVFLTLVILSSTFIMQINAASIYGDYYVAGVKELCGSLWIEDDDANLMTYGDDGLFRKTYENVAPDFNYDFRVTDGTWAYSWGNGNYNYTFYVTDYCDVSIVFDPYNEEVSVEGDYVVIPEGFNVEQVVVAGAAVEGSTFVNGVDWSPGESSNVMSKSYGDIYTITYKNVAQNDGYSFKFVMNNSWSYNLGASRINSDGSTLIWDGANINFDVPYEYADVTITLDLSNFDYENGKSGAVYSIELEETEAPTEAVEPVTEAAEMETVESNPAQSALSLTTAFNGNEIETISCKGTSVTVTYNLQSPLLIEEGQGTLYYDSTKLSLESVSLPNIQSGLIVNNNTPGEIKFNFTGYSIDTNSGIYDFKTEKVFITAVFNIIGTGDTIVDLDLEELSGEENYNYVSYYHNGVASSEASVITQSLSKPAVEANSQDQYNETTVPAEEKPIVPGFYVVGSEEVCGVEWGWDKPWAYNEPMKEASDGTYYQVFKNIPSSYGNTGTDENNVYEFKVVYVSENGGITWHPGGMGNDTLVNVARDNSTILFQFKLLASRPTREGVDPEAVIATVYGPDDSTPDFSSVQYPTTPVNTESPYTDPVFTTPAPTIAPTAAPTEPAVYYPVKTVVAKKSNPMKVSVKKITVKSSKLRKKALTIKPIKIKNARGKVTYKKYKKGSTILTYKRLTVNKNTGKIKIKKNYYPKGTFKVGVKITVKGNAYYKAKTVIKHIKVKVK